MEGETPVFAKLEIFRMSSAMAVHAGRRQAVIAQNVANADTPGFRARDIKGFAESYQIDMATPMRKSRAGHLSYHQNNYDDEVFADYQSGASPNGNSVSLETELMKAAEVKSTHDRATAIYKSALNILRHTVAK